MEYPGIDGFLGTRASIMLDVVFLVMFAILPALAYSIVVVKKRRNYARHRQIQLALAVSLLIAVTLFEVDVRFISGWEERAVPSRYYDGPEGGRGTVGILLYIHLFFAITTTVLWLVVVPRAMRGFDRPPVPNDHSRSHIFWARLAAIDMACTAITGWTFYAAAFVA